MNAKSRKRIGGWFAGHGSRGTVYGIRYTVYGIRYTVYGKEVKKLRIVGSSQFAVGNS